MWTDPGGFDAYRVEPRFGPIDYKPTAAEREKSDVWSAHYNTPRPRTCPRQSVNGCVATGIFPGCKETVDQFVIHYDVAGTSKNCFEILQDKRGLSVHFMLDVDGTIYQSLDLKERAWHATIANSRSVGIEVANIGAYPLNDSKALDAVVSTGGPTARFNSSSLTRPGPRCSTTGIELLPSRNEPVVGTVQGQELQQYDFTPQQYEALDQADGDAVHDLSQDPLRLPA